MKVNIYFASALNSWIIEGGQWDGVPITQGSKVRVTLNGVHVTGTWIRSAIDGGREWIEFESGETKVFMTPGTYMDLEILKMEGVKHEKSKSNE